MIILNFNEFSFSLHSSLICLTISEPDIEYIIGKKAVWKTIARKGYDSTDKSKQS